MKYQVYQKTIGKDDFHYVTPLLDTLEEAKAEEEKAFAAADENTLTGIYFNQLWR